MIKAFRHWWQATKWESRAADMEYQGYMKPKSWDCDVRCTELIHEMVKSGLRLGRDFVLVRCKNRLTEQNHVFIELFGTNQKDRTGNHDVVNGYIIDPTPQKLSMLTRFSKGEYTLKGEDFYG